LLHEARGILAVRVAGDVASLMELAPPVIRRPTRGLQVQIYLDEMPLYTASPKVIMLA
jgi:hypothetical protein